MRLTYAGKNVRNKAHDSRNLLPARRSLVIIELNIIDTLLYTTKIAAQAAELIKNNALQHKRMNRKANLTKTPEIGF